MWRLPIRWRLQKAGAAETLLRNEVKALGINVELLLKAYGSSVFSYFYHVWYFCSFPGVTEFMSIVQMHISKLRLKNQLFHLVLICV